MNVVKYMEEHPDNLELIEAWQNYVDIKECFFAHIRSNYFREVMNFGECPNSYIERFQCEQLNNAILAEIKILARYNEELVSCRNAFYDKLNEVECVDDLPFT